ncbi:predicted protein [Histoplasma capsulatum H143]|uniref:Uncharacterized protein n=1 Tax=Ajellomyces capsulatus (strain H143) TaxID=544712 RepID=C6H5T1_AJECH|nr:predicted protein [Histoplasma capsulatum H143]
MATCEVVEELHRGGSSGVTTSYWYCNYSLSLVINVEPIHVFIPSNSKRARSGREAEARQQSRLILNLSRQRVLLCSDLLCSALLCSALLPPSPSPDDSTQRRTAATAGGGGAMTLAGARHIIIIITIILASTSDDQVLRGMVYTIAFVCATRETVYSVEYQSLQSRRGMNE